MLVKCRELAVDDRCQEPTQSTFPKTPLQPLLHRSGLPILLSFSRSIIEPPGAPRGLWERVDVTQGVQAYYPLHHSRTAGRLSGPLISIAPPNVFHRRHFGWSMKAVDYRAFPRSVLLRGKRKKASVLGDTWEMEGSSCIS